MTTQLTWIDSAGVSTPLVEAGGYKLLRGTMGLGEAAPQNSIDDFVAFDGAVLVKRRRSTLGLLLPLLVRHATRVQTKIEELASMLERAPGQIQYDDGVNTRTLKNVIYEGGLGGDLSNAPFPVWRKVAVALLALDPWWYGPANSQALSTSAVTAFDAAIAFDSAIAFDGGAATGVNVSGDTDAYPVITVQGPATTLTVGSGGLVWSIAAALSASDVLIVDHRPGSRGPRLNAGGVDWSLLTEASRLWTLPRGVASVVTGIVGGSGATAINMSWEPRYLTP